MILLAQLSIIALRVERRLDRLCERRQLNAPFAFVITVTCSSRTNPVTSHQHQTYTG